MQKKNWSAQRQTCRSKFRLKTNSAYSTRTEKKTPGYIGAKPRKHRCTTCFPQKTSLYSLNHGYFNWACFHQYLPNTISAVKFHVGYDKNISILKSQQLSKIKQIYVGFFNHALHTTWKQFLAKLGHIYAFMNSFTQNILKIPKIISG